MSVAAQTSWVNPKHAETSQQSYGLRSAGVGLLAVSESADAQGQFRRETPTACTVKVTQVGTQKISVASALATVCLRRDRPLQGGRLGIVLEKSSVDAQERNPSVSHPTGRGRHWTIQPGHARLLDCSIAIGVVSM